jgi:hypothetical protein
MRYGTFSRQCQEAKKAGLELVDVVLADIRFQLQNKELGRTRFFGQIDNLRSQMQY